MESARKVDGDVQTIFQQAQVFVAGAKQGFDIRAYLNILLHLGSEDSLQLVLEPPIRGTVARIGVVGP